MINFVIKLSILLRDIPSRSMNHKVRLKSICKVMLHNWAGIFPVYLQGYSDATAWP